MVTHGPRQHNRESRAGRADAETQSATRRTGRDLRRMLESRPSVLADDDTFEDDISNGLAMLTLPTADPWTDAWSGDRQATPATVNAWQPRR